MTNFLEELEQHIQYRIKIQQPWIDNPLGCDGHEAHIKQELVELLDYVKRLKERANNEQLDIARQAQRDLFGSHQTAAAEEAERRYQSRFAPDCCHLVSTKSYVLELQRAFVEGSIWKEEAIKNEKIKNNG